MSRKRLSVADVRGMKGKYQFTMLRVETLDELAAAEKAGVDMVSVSPETMALPHFRDVAPSVFAVPGVAFFDVGTADDFVRWAFRLYKATADAVYCSASLATVKRLSDEAIPVIGHVGLRPVYNCRRGDSQTEGDLIQG
jgi:3-methyl-2-oxobutanoate hydroxymethyltransferase